jgi:2-oxoglutarate dehydrogenase E2 component (dihydrolipoamide succinyltransferase)
MIVEIKVPDLGESINEVEIGEWAFEVGGELQQDDALVEIESEKATLAIPAPEAGVLIEIIRKQGETAAIGDVIGRIDTGQQGGRQDGGTRETRETAEAGPEAAGKTAGAEAKAMPAAARAMARHQLSADRVEATGPGGRILKEDVQRAVADEVKKAAAEKPSQAVKEKPAAGNPAERQLVSRGETTGGERRVPMTLIRRTIAARLVKAKQSMAMLTTFNEADMSQVKKIRAGLGPLFADKYGVRLGFMSFFVKAVVAALKDFPLVNARIDNDDIVYQEYYDIGVAIGGGKGLVVPVIRDAQQLSFAEIEAQIARFGEQAKNNSLSMDDLSGGTFTISNGGVYGSMLSTPIVNPPQSAILGLHAIKDRPVAIDGEVVIRPVMYLALSYDHRIIDGREAVSFLKTIKELIEDPQKLLLEI